jgi:hypothetical protein
MVNKNAVLVWDGILETLGGGDGGYDVKWHGVVVANEDAADASSVPEPPRNAFKEFVDSDLQFNVSGTARPIEGNANDGNKFKPFVVSLTSGEGWDYGGNKNKDDVHDVHVTSLLWRGSPDQRDSIVVATGKSGGHGSFVSVGWMRPGNRVTLARRYVEDSDSRAGWTPEELRKNILEQIYREEDDTIIMPPWKCAALNA